MANFLGAALRTVLNLFLVSLLLVATLGAQDSSLPNYHSAVSEVRLVFFATDENNHPVEDLQRDDFAVVDDESQLPHAQPLDVSGVR